MNKLIAALLLTLVCLAPLAFADKDSAPGTPGSPGHTGDGGGTTTIIYTNIPVPGPVGPVGPRGEPGLPGRDCNPCVAKDGRDGVSIKGDKGDRGDPGTNANVEATVLNVAPADPTYITDAFTPVGKVSLGTGTYILHAYVDLAPTLVIPQEYVCQVQSIGERDVFDTTPTLTGAQMRVTLLAPLVVVSGTRKDIVVACRSNADAQVVKARVVVMRVGDIIEGK